MKDKDVIQQAYEAALSAIFAAFVSAYTAAFGDKQKEDEAGTHFQKGVLHIRHIRDRALELLQ